MNNSYVCLCSDCLWILKSFPMPFKPFPQLSHKKIRKFCILFICFYRFESSIPGNPGGTEQCWTSPKPRSIRWRRFQVSLMPSGNRNYLLFRLVPSGNYPDYCLGWEWDPAETILTIVKVGTQRELFQLFLCLGPNKNGN